MRPVAFSDELVTGIKQIYDETPVRQGRRFWHYQKPLERVRMLNSTYLDRSQFVGAYVADELIGFIKYIRVDQTAILIQILAKDGHRDKRTINALLRQTVELCSRQGLALLTYGKFDYGLNQESSLTEFKRRNGFTELRFPRYFVPLTLMGGVEALRLDFTLAGEHVPPLRHYKSSPSAREAGSYRVQGLGACSVMMVRPLRLWLD